jgi:RNA polymerase sigma factor (sigma-70 family)
MGQQSAFEQVALPHLEAAHNLAYWLVRSRPDAEDIVQDAFVRAFRAFGGFRGGDIKPWLLTIVRNVAYRWLAVRKRGSNVVSIDAFAPRDGSDVAGEAWIAADEPSPEAMLIGAQERARVLTALAGLPPPFREVLVLREIEELSYNEIADVIGTPVGTVMSRLARARTELRKRLGALIEKEEKNAM